MGDLASDYGVQNYTRHIPARAIPSVSRRKSADSLRCAAYMRLAQTIGISWLDVRRSAAKTR